MKSHHTSLLNKIKPLAIIMALFPVSVSAQTTVTWSTLGNTTDTSGQPVYTQRFTIDSDTDFSRLAFNSFSADMKPVNPADTVVEIVPGYYAVSSPRFAESKGNAITVDLVTKGSFSKICFAPDGVHLVKADGTTSPVEMKWDDIIKSPNLYSTPETDRMPYGDAIYGLNKIRNKAENIRSF